MTTIQVRTKKRIRENPNIRTFHFDWPTSDKVTMRLRDILEPEVRERYYLPEEKTAKLVKQLETQKGSDNVEVIGHIEGVRGRDICKRLYSPAGVSPTLLTGTSGNTTPKIVKIERVGNIYPAGICGTVYKETGLSPTLNTNESGGVRVLTEEPKPQQFSDGSGIAYTVDANYVKGTSPGDVGKGRRTHVLEDVVPEVRPVLTPDREEKRQNGRRFKDNDEEAFTLTAQDKHGIAVGKYPQYRIRKLTPRECWRLQGFTDEQFDKAKAARVSDTQLYKQAGNAVTVNVISAISRRLIPLLEKGSVCGNIQAPEMEAVV